MQVGGEGKVGGKGESVQSSGLGVFRTGCSECTGEMVGRGERKREREGGFLVEYGGGMNIDGSELVDTCASFECSHTVLGCLRVVL